MNKQGASLGFADTIWNFFASVRLTVVVLLTLAVTSIIGTLIPQNAEPAGYIQKYGVEAYRIFSILNLTDMYHSGWFRFFMAMLTMNIVVCSLDRLSATLKIVFVKNPKFQIERFRGLDDNSGRLSSKTPAELISLYSDRVSGWFGYWRTEETDRGVAIFAEKGRWCRLGFYLVHMSIVLLLLGGLIGSIFGFDGNVNIPEGESVGEIHQSNSQVPIALDFRIQCDDFSVSFYETGQPKEYKSRLTLLEGGNPVLTREIVVNQPLRYKGINIFQSSYGQMPSVQGRLDPEKILLNFEDLETKSRFSVTAAVGKSVQLPENRGAFLIKQIEDAKVFRGMNLGHTVVGELSLSGQAPKEILLPTQFPKFDKMRQGRMIITLKETEPRYYTGLQVTSDPGVWLVYVGFMMLILGCLVTFFMSHQRLCIEVMPSGQGSRVIVTGMANKNKLGMQHKVKRIAAQLARLDA
ncbi:MAG: cytochrome c biogenesis protein ResB [Desulfobacterales bacterium]|jgi:cytochrome c biogenesis protein|nr:cytochrome c biogenesis protein ResB [Desulfobacterales bacterium]